MTHLIKAKLNTFRKDPVGSVEAKVQSEVLSFLDWWGQHRLRSKGIMNALLPVLMDRPTVAIPPDFADLWFLYRTVRLRKPRIIWEFGSGCSTVILVQALYDNHRDSSNAEGYLHSIDADPYWTEATAQSIPAYLHQSCEIRYSPLLEVEYEGTLGFRHANVPKVAPNFLYLDGPALTPARQVAMDVLDIEDRLPADFCMVIDGRRKNAVFLRENLKRQYNIKERKLFNNEIFELIS